MGEKTVTLMMTKTKPGGMNMKYGFFMPCIGLGISILMLFSACSVSRNPAYFKTLQQDTTLTGFISNDFESLIQPGDVLSIVASSLSAQEDLLFNQAAGEKVGELNQLGFKVRPEGKVLLHKLGMVQAAGLTRRQLAADLQERLLPYMKDPIVHVNYLNHKVTVLGEVSQPQVIQMPEEQLSLIDVLVKSGDITEAGIRNKVMLIREEGDKKQVKFLNLEDHSIFSSPYYYVLPNDVVYVLPDHSIRMKEDRRRNLQTTLSLVASGVSLFVIILDRIIK